MLCAIVLLFPHSAHCSCDDCCHSFCPLFFNPVFPGFFIITIVARKFYPPSYQTLTPMEEDFEHASVQPCTFKEISISELKVGKVIGSGSFSTVHVGIWRNANVAVKKIPVHDENTKQQMLLELVIYVKIGNHPNILPFIGACTTEFNALYILSKYCDQGSLYSILLEQQRKISTAQFRSILIQSSSGLAHLHSQNVIHRDVTSRNFLLASPFSIYIADYGISRILRPTLEANTTQSEIGPIRWLSPESVFEGIYSTKTDSYMYSMFLYEILFRKIPFFELPNLFDVSDAIQEGNRPTILDDSLPSIFMDIFVKCWSTNPSERYEMVQIVNIFEQMDSNQIMNEENHPNNIIEPHYTAVVV